MLAADRGTYLSASPPVFNSGWTRKDPRLSVRNVVHKVPGLSVMGLQTEYASINVWWSL